MYIDPTVPRNHKIIDCLAEIIFRYYGVISLQKPRTYKLKVIRDNVT
ncbi:hypothetical protein SLEP1_g18998 [Rubroshorea leprosula]|nr:hypothetical protein SLEP1_g18998 [Rubroshorea leprosula]